MWELGYNAAGKKYDMRFESIDTLHIFMVSIKDMFPDTAFTVKYQGK